MLVRLSRQTSLFPSSQARRRLIPHLLPDHNGFAAPDVPFTMHLRAAVLLLLAAMPLEAAEWRWSGPSGGATRALVAAPSNPRVQYLGTVGGVFRSTDGGETWSDITGPVTYPSLLAVHPEDERIVLAVDDGLDLSSYQTPDTLYRTTDGGTTWTKVGSGLPAYSVDVSGLAVSPHDPNVILLSSRCQPFWAKRVAPNYHEAAGVFKSIDGGATFLPASNGMTFFQRCAEGVSFDPARPGIVYATPGFTDDGFARSADNGETWTHAPTPVPGDEVVFDPRTGRRYGLTTRASGLLVSDDEGEQWTPTRPVTLDNSDNPFVDGDDSLAIDRVSGRLFIGTDDGAYRSGDGGRSVLPLGGVGREPIAGMIFDSTSGALVIGTDRGVYRSAGFPWNDWRLLDTGDRLLAILDLAPSRRDPETLYAAAGRQIYVTRNGGATWQLYGDPLPRLNDGVPSITTMAIDAADTLYVVTEYVYTKAFFRLPAGASEWIESSLPPANWYGHVHASPNAPGVVYLERSGGFLGSSDGGSTWRVIETPPLTSGSALGIDPDDAAVIYGGTNAGLLESSDGGRTWSAKTATNIFIEDVAVSPADKKTIYFLGRELPQYRELFYRSTDGGESWTSPGELPGEVGAGDTLAADPRDARIVYIAGRRIFRSLDGGATWKLFEHGLPLHIGPGPPYFDTRKVAPNLNGTMLHAATARGMWTRSLTERRRSVLPR